VDLYPKLNKQSIILADLALQLTFLFCCYST